MSQSEAQAPLRVEIDEAALDAIFGRFKSAELPGVAVGVAVGGRPRYRKGFGQTSLEAPAALSPRTPMRIASVSKHFTCLAYLLLCEAGLASLDDPLVKHLPELGFDSHGPTVREIMGHISGLRDASDWFFYDPRGRVTSSDVLAFYQGRADVNGPPATGWRYNDGAYSLLGMAIERIAAEPLEAVFRERILDPIGMHDTAFGRWDEDVEPSAATPYFVHPDGRFENIVRFNEAAGQGGLVSTVDDMLRWLAHMDAPVVGSAKTWALMKTPQALANGTMSGYGLSLVWSRYRGADILWHAGMLLGGRALMLKVPDAGLDVIVIANRHDAVANDLTLAVLDACLLGLVPRRPHPEPFAEGIFRSPRSGRVIRLFRRGDQQFASIDGSDRIVELRDDGRLHTINHLKQAITLEGDPAAPAALTFRDFGFQDQFERLPPPSPGRDVGVEGRFRSDAWDYAATVTAGFDRGRLELVGRFGATTHDLERLADGVWRARATNPLGYAGVLTFAEDGRRFALTTASNLAVPFSRVG